MVSVWVEPGAGWVQVKAFLPVSEGQSVDRLPLPAQKHEFPHASLVVQRARNLSWLSAIREFVSESAASAASLAYVKLQAVIKKTGSAERLLWQST